MVGTVMTGQRAKADHTIVMHVRNDQVKAHNGQKVLHDTSVSAKQAVAQEVLGKLEASNQAVTEEVLG